MTNKKFYISTVIVAIIVFMSLIDFILPVPDAMIVTYIRTVSLIAMLLSTTTITLSGLVLFSKKNKRWQKVVAGLYIVIALIVTIYQFLNLVLTALTWGSA